MIASLGDYRCKLINKILFAASQEEVKKTVNTAMKYLQDNKVNEYVFAGFIDNATKSLEEFKPVDYNAQQWANIHYARMQFRIIQRENKSSNNI